MRSLLVVPLVVFCVSGYASEYTENLQKQLNQCRSEYKAMASDAQNQIDNAIAQRRIPSQQIQSWKKQVQQKINQKAAECKRIKQELLDAPAKEAAEANRRLQQQKLQEEQAKKIAEEKRIKAQKAAELKSRIWNAPSGKKVGPKVQCFRLGQNGNEVLSCAGQLGYSQISLDQFTEEQMKSILGTTAQAGWENMLSTGDSGDALLALGSALAMADMDKTVEKSKGIILQSFGIAAEEYGIFFKHPSTSRYLVVRLGTESFNADKFLIEGTEFWGTKEFSEPFLRALMANYDIPELKYEVHYDEAENRTKESYFYEGDGWKIKIPQNEVLPVVEIEKTAGSKDFRF